MGGAYIKCGERRGVCKVYVRHSDGNKQLGRHKSRWEDNIKMDLQEVEWGGHGLDLSGSR